MPELSLVTKIGIAGTLLFTALFWYTPADKTYETVEMETVHVRSVWLFLLLCSLAFLMAPLFLE